MTSHSALIRAILAWRQGVPAPLDVLTTLLAAGYDIGRLEAKHFAY